MKDARPRPRIAGRQNLLASQGGGEKSGSMTRGAREAWRKRILARSRVAAQKAEEKKS